MNGVSERDQNPVKVCVYFFIALSNVECPVVSFLLFLWRHSTGLSHLTTFFWRYTVTRGLCISTQLFLLQVLFLVGGSASVEAFAAAVKI